MLPFNVTLVQRCTSPAHSFPALNVTLRMTFNRSGLGTEPSWIVNGTLPALVCATMSEQGVTFPLALRSHPESEGTYLFMLKFAFERSDGLDDSYTLHVRNYETAGRVQIVEGIQTTLPTDIPRATPFLGLVSWVVLGVVVLGRAHVLRSRR